MEAFPRALAVETTVAVISILGFGDASSVGGKRKVRRVGPLATLRYRALIPIFPLISSVIRLMIESGDFVDFVVSAKRPSLDFWAARQIR